MRREILFFALFVKASPQDEHGVERLRSRRGVGAALPHIIQLGLSFARYAS